MDFLKCQLWLFHWIMCSTNQCTLSSLMVVECGSENSSKQCSENSDHPRFLQCGHTENGELTQTVLRTMNSFSGYTVVVGTLGMIVLKIVTLRKSGPVCQKTKTFIRTYSRIPNSRPNRNSVHKGEYSTATKSKVQI